VPHLDRRFFVRNWLDGKPVSGSGSRG
jgi:hypothetical protein